MRNKYFSPLLLASAVLACDSGDIDEVDESLDEVAEGEGPWIGGVFDHREPAPAGSHERVNPPEAGAVRAPDDPLTEVIVLLARDADALPRGLSRGAARPVEDAVVAGVQGGESSIIKHFGGPVGARHLLALRLTDEARRELIPDSPEDRLHRYVVLRFATLEEASRVAAELAGQRGVEFAAVNEAFAFSAAPDDPYLPIKTVAARYQWGMHAMRFLTAWTATPGNAWLGAADGGVVSHTDLQGVRSHLSFTVGSPLPVVAVHGSHVSGILAATTNNTAGVAGGCPGCSVVMGAFPGNLADSAAAIAGLVDRGVQVINMSFGLNGRTCATVQPVCDAVAMATARDVLLVGAAGNFNKTAPDFPASLPGVLAVGGVQNSNPAQPSQWQAWWYNAANGTTAAGLNGVVGPARSIVSTTPVSGAYSSLAWVMCGDQNGFDESGTPGDGYGSCTGTSMATPHVAALGGLLRSIQPRLSAEGVKSLIRQSGSHAASRTAQLGYGLPDASKAVQQAVAGAGNRLTPLFSFYSAGRLDHFYTAVPQMASAAVLGKLQPGVGANPPAYATVGGTLNGYAGFPGITPSASRTPRAQAWIFTTPANPKNATVPLVPLYRLSWKCGDPGESPVCPQNPSHTDFVYTTDSNGITSYSAWGYRLDGIEGYIYPKTIAQPAGTVRLMRKYNAARDDHAIFPESELAAMQAQGYTVNSGSDWLGYVYPNTGSTPSV